MNRNRLLRSRIAGQLALIAASRGDTPVIVVPGDVDNVDMFEVICDLTKGMGYEHLTMIVRHFYPHCGFLDTPVLPSFAPSECYRLHLLDARAPRDKHLETTDDQMISEIIQHIASSGGVRSPIVVVSPFGVDGVHQHAIDLRAMTGLSERDLFAVN